MGEVTLATGNIGKYKIAECVSTRGAEKISRYFKVYRIVKAIGSYEYERF